jgi:hypothetical protein
LTARPRAGIKETPNKTVPTEEPFFGAGHFSFHHSCGTARMIRTWASKITVRPLDPLVSGFGLEYLLSAIALKISF